MKSETPWIAICLLLFYFSGTVALIALAYLLFYTQYYWVTLLYVVFYVYDRKTMHQGGRPSEWVRDWTLWKHASRYFPMQLITTSEMDSSKNYLLAIFPHGPLPLSCLCMVSNTLNAIKLFPGISISVIALDFFFYVPVMRELLLAMGCSSSSKQSLNYLLDDSRQGSAVLLYVGGAKEAFLCRPGDYHVVLRNRKGFVRVALASGASIVPVFAFGENELYSQEGTLAQMILRALGKLVKKDIPILAGGTGLLGLLPKRLPINIVVGKPIAVEKSANPTEKQVSELHQRFMDDLMTLFEGEKHKYLANATNVSLIIQ